MTSPQVSVSAEYHGEGQFNALKIEAFGTVNTTMSKCSFTMLQKL